MSDQLAELLAEAIDLNLRAGLRRKYLHESSCRSAYR
jgi:hypothetical protein